LKAPTAGESLRRGLTYFIRWQDNIAENVVLQLYKANTLIKVISTNAPSTGAFRWQIPPELPPGSDYAIRIASATNSNLSDITPEFGIDAPAINADSVVLLSNGKVGFSLTAYGLPEVTVSASTNLVVWQDLSLVSLTNGGGYFVDGTATNYSQRFYRLRIPQAGAR
jgi:hypothetical protein